TSFSPPEVNSPAARLPSAPVSPEAPPPHARAHPVQAEADRQFKSKPPKKGIQGIFGDDIPGMEGLGTGLQSLELHELAQYGII
uniref:Retinal rod rhodopsin-sensitive cGMP 3',5'-cyclic phosphodiesterase subunit gamma n=1 Tax=Labrus bergylta TaxID=56723 RepID=A0A3Q3ERT0_9LABR